jgi:hypothetical protein
MTNLMSEGQGGCCGGAQNNQRDYELHIDTRLDASAVFRVTLPVPSNESCCSTGVAGDEIAGTNGSREVGSLGQVLTLVATRDHGGVTAGCGCGPDRDTSVFQKEGQSPLGVDALNRSPLNLVRRDDVADIDARLANDESGSPECCVNGQCEECSNADSTKGVDDVACCGVGCCGATEDKNKDNGQYSTRAGHESRHVLNGVTEATR